MGKGRLALVGIPLLSLGLWFALSDSGKAPPSAPEPADNEQVAATPDARAGEQSATETDQESSAEVEREASAKVEQAPTRTEAQVTFRGRCVDENGNPLAEVRAHLHGWTANRDRQTAYEKKNGKVVWKDPEDVFTGADGRFEVRFVPPPPYQFTLDLALEDRVEMGGRWFGLEPGETRDFGDIVLPTGAQLSGRIVDAEGSLVLPKEKNTAILINPIPSGSARSEEIRPRFSLSAKVALDGTFAFKKRVAIGTWGLNLRGLTLAPDANGQIQRNIEVAEARQEIELVVVRPESIKRVTGRVLDQRGDPVYRATITAAGRFGSGRLCSTNRDGRFDLQRFADDNDDSPFQIQVQHDGYVHFVSEQNHAWGDREVVLRVQSGSPLEVAVRSSLDGQPVERFRVWVHTLESTPMWSRPHSRIRDTWDHKGGTMKITRVVPGRYLVEIDVEDDSPVATASAEVEILPDQPARLDIALPRRVSQPLNVRFADGRPATGSEVQLIDTRGEEFTATSTPRVRASGRMSTSDVGYLIASAKVGAQGSATVSGPEGKSFVLRVAGEHEPHIVQDFRLSEEARDIELPSPASAVFQLQPVEVVTQWLSMLDELKEMERWRAVPRISLVSRAGDGVTFPEVQAFEEPGKNGRIDQTGKALLTGIPPGSWSVFVFFPNPSSASSGPRYLKVADLEATAGEQLDLVLDVSAERTGTVELTVRMNGEPFLGRVTFLPVGAPLPNWPRSIGTDEKGFGKGYVPAGNYTLELSARYADENESPDVPVETQLVVVAGQTTQATIDASTLDRPFRLLMPNGDPYEGIPPTPQGLDGTYAARVLPGKDGKGLRITGAPGSYKILVPIRSRSTRDAFAEAQEEIFGSWQPGMDREPFIQRFIAEVMVEVGPIDVKPSKGVLELQLPASWDR